MRPVGSGKHSMIAYARAYLPGGLKTPDVMNIRPLVEINIVRNRPSVLEPDQLQRLPESGTYAGPVRFSQCGMRERPDAGRNEHSSLTLNSVICYSWLSIGSQYKKVGTVGDADSRQASCQRPDSRRHHAFRSGRSLYLE